MMNNVAAYSRGEDVEVETVFVHVTDAPGGTNVLNGLRTGRTEIDGIPQAPRPLSSRWLLTKARNQDI